jgi:hypothetical protein
VVKIKNMFKILDVEEWKKLLWTDLSRLEDALKNTWTTVPCFRIVHAPKLARTLPNKFILFQA